MVRLTHVIGLATALVGLITAALVLWQGSRTPDQSHADGGDPTLGPEITDRSSATSTPETTTSPVESDSAEDAKSDSSGQTGDDEPAEGDLPDVTGLNSIDARDYLGELGFTNIVLYDDDHSWVGAKPEHCTVREQDPQGGRQVHLDIEIRLGYYEDPWSDPDELCT